MYRKFCLFLSIALLHSACKKDKEDTSQPSGGGNTPAVEEPLLTDIDGNTYRMVTIGGRTWMAENLRTARYRDGSLIPVRVGDVEWNAATFGVCAAYEGHYINDQLFGKLYNGYAVLDGRGLCPLGWHVPTDLEWQAMELALGMEEPDLESAGFRGVAQSVGRQLKDTLTWSNGPQRGTNTSGFTALPSGFRQEAFTSLGIVAQLWTSTQSATNTVLVRELHYNNAGIRRFGGPIRNGCCVRCIQD